MHGYGAKHFDKIRIYKSQGMSPFATVFKVGSQRDPENQSEQVIHVCLKNSQIV